ncbi:MAG: extracellular solute-binding protein [Kiritimatiellae bacterium]|nr:extracellular solute-binding protein [Kiritimatiellia bacterium]
MFKRTLIIATILCMIAGSLIGCADAGNTTGASSTTTKASSTQGTSTTTTTSSTTSNGPQVTAPGELPVTTEQVTLTLGLQQNLRVSDYEENFMTKMVLDECGIELDFILFPSDQPLQKVQLMISSGEVLPDIMHVGLSDAQRASYGADGVILPLNDYMDNLTFWYDQADMDPEEYELIKVLGTSPDGNFYGFPAYMNEIADIVQYMTNINRTWLETLDLEMPTTTDQFREVLTAFRDQDPNQNGKKDEVPFLAGPAWGGNGWQEIINCFVYWQPWYNTSFFNVTDGQLWAPFITDEWREALRYMSGLVKDGLMSELSFSITGQEYRAAVDLTPEQVDTIGVINGDSIVLWASGNEHMYDYDAMPALKGPSGESFIPTRTPNYSYTTYITKDNKYPEISFRMFDYWWEERRSLITRFGEPGVHWEYYKDDPTGFKSRYPYLNYDAQAQNLPEAKHIQIAGVQNPWTSSEPHASIWSSHFCCGLPARTYSAVASMAPVPTTWAEAREKGYGTEAHRSYLYVSFYQQRNGLEPEETAKRLLFTEEEQAAIDEIRTTINSYINETIALFSTGVMNIETDWDAYVQTLKDMGLELYMQTSQDAYDRMYK